jgi:hypothetical protein
MSATTRALPSAEEIGALLPIGQIAKDTPYSADFLRQLARSGKIRAFKLNRDWLTTPETVLQYLRNQRSRYEGKIAALHKAERSIL